MIVLICMVTVYPRNSINRGDYEYHCEILMAKDLRTKDRPYFTLSDQIRSFTIDIKLDKNQFSKPNVEGKCWIDLVEYDIIDVYLMDNAITFYARCGQDDRLMNVTFRNYLHDDYHDLLGNISCFNVSCVEEESANKPNVSYAQYLFAYDHYTKFPAEYYSVLQKIHDLFQYIG